MRRSISKLSLSALRACRVPAVFTLATLRLTQTPHARSCTAVAAGALTLPRRFASDAALADATRRELEEEMGRSDKPEQPTPPAGWQVSRKPGTCTFDMTKSYEGEELVVRYSTNQDSDKANSHDIYVYVKQKSGQTMQTDLSIEEGELVLNNIRFYDNAQLAMDMSAEGAAKREELYTGPLVHELDYDMLNCVMTYLEKRGVDEKLGEFVILYSFWAEQQDYEAWLSTMNKFVS
ncbi:putative mitochondrial P22 protein precursor [Leptomonas pyrrhocoris]|uniref:Putative mitochondrial P22 protein n=1 Tax=Leptomonas pyrrhocoris TaxID=157538 RepID=A0A0M9G624_LEPPY|nr:putative mitochondrial P22 protein precursor [Leptomonas pyrrhocoris]KPA83107.1 putative mitochondrial P22 protein precursor [Leptomonas pyrrhocoris]|eukprot:XP_015661546.1 putative mitochondrial P22 protein precursor [Leptomonas pyrrhocoris]